MEEEWVEKVKFWVLEIIAMIKGAGFEDHCVGFPFEDFSELFLTYFTVFPKASFPDLIVVNTKVGETQDPVLSLYKKAFDKFLSLIQDLIFSIKKEDFSVDFVEKQLVKSVNVLEKLIKVDLQDINKNPNLDSTICTSGKSDPLNSPKNDSFRVTENQNPLFQSCNSSFVQFSSYLSQAFSSISSKLNQLSMQLETCFNNINKVLSSTSLSLLKALRNYEKNYKINSNLQLSDQKLVILLTELLKSKNSFPISPSVEIYIKPSFSSPSQDLLLQNSSLKSEVLEHEGVNVKIRAIEAELKSAKEKIDWLEKVNKELTMSKADSDDSLDLPSGNIKEAIEIQELRAALHNITEKCEQEKETLIRDMMESRQDMENQVFRIQNEKVFLESNLKDCEKIIQESQREKDRLYIQISSLKKDLDRLKDLQTSENSCKIPNSRRRSSEFLFAPSYDFELSESIDKFNPACICEEMNEILEALRNLGLVKEAGIDLQGVKKLFETTKKIREIVEKEEVFSKDIELDLGISQIFNRFKGKIVELESKVVENNTKVRKNAYVVTEPSPRRSSPSHNPTNHQLQVEKSKLLNKKTEILLHKEQIVALKKNIRDLQQELEKSRKIDLGYIREGWFAFAKELGVQSSSTENLMEVFMKLLGFTNNDVKILQNERKTKKKGLKFGFF